MKFKSQFKEEKRQSFIRKFEQLPLSLVTDKPYEYYNEKDCIFWINPKAKNGSRNLNFYSFNRRDYSELNQMLNKLSEREEKMRKQGYDLGGIKSFNRNIWLDLSRESSAIEGIMDDFSYDLLDFRAKLRGEFAVDPSLENFDYRDYFKKLYEQTQKIKQNNDSRVIIGNKKAHPLSIATINHFIAFKYIYHCAKANRKNADVSSKEFVEILKNASALMSGNELVTFRTMPAKVTDTKWNTARPDEVVDRMDTLCKWVVDGSQSGGLNPIEKAAFFHAEFIRIHPFVDGNGRTGRIMSNYILIKNEMPTVALRYQNTDEYFAALNKAITTHEIDDLIDIFYNSVCNNAQKIDECLDYIEKNNKKEKIK